MSIFKRKKTEEMSDQQLRMWCIAVLRNYGPYSDFIEKANKLFNYIKSGKVIEL